MNSINEQILDAVSILIDSNNKKLKFDRTIKCQITNADRAQSGEYKVSYFGDNFTAYSQDTTKVYKVNDKVYVRVPENNMDNKKFITEKVTSKNDYELSLEEIDSIYKVDLVGIAWDKIYPYPTKACVEVIGEKNSNRLYYNSLLNTNLDLEFQKYAKENTIFLVQGKFTTNFTEIPEKGNWGLKITFKYKTPTDSADIKYRTVSYTIDHTSMTGNSYNYNNSSVQYALFSVEGSYLLGIEGVELFHEGIELKNGGSICVEDLLFQFVTPIEDFSTYSINILTKEGVYLNERNHRQITLEAEYKYKGKNILNKSTLSNYSIYWFKEDKKVGRFSEDYTKEGGIGWKQIDRDKIAITIDKQDVMTSIRYKLVIKYDDYQLEKIVEVYYEDSTYTMEMAFSQNGDDLSLATLEVLINPTSSDYKYYWLKETYDGETEEINNNNNRLQIDITSIYSSTIYYCTVYKGDFLLGTVKYLISTDIQENDVEVEFIGGNTTYLYDEAGDISLEASEERKSLSYELKWRNGKASQYIAEWILPPENETMLTGFIYNEDKTILYYKLLPKFNAQRSNNTISLVIKLNNGREFRFNKEFIFLKQGDPGTNGTTFTTKITSTADYLISGPTPLSSMQLSVTAYKDGELASNLGYNVSTSWSIASNCSSLTQITVSNSGRVSGVSGKFGDKNLYGNIVRAATTISKGTDKTIVYNYFPVPILIYTQNRNFRITSGFNKVLYSSDGYNPSYASTTPWETNSLVNPSWDKLGKNEVGTIQTEENKTFLKMPKKYLSTDGPIAMQAQVGNDIILYPIAVTLNAYGLDWINGWDGLTVDINNGQGTILAPMIGAGEKDTDNKFTGTVMGVHVLNTNTSGYDKTVNGLIGYKEGLAVYGMLTDGTMFIGGPTKGRLEFDGKAGTIQSANFSSTEGMKIDLSQGRITAHDFQLKTGTIFMNAIPSASGTNTAIGIQKTKGDDTTGEYVFKVNHNGKLFCTNADIEGKITATSGQIAGFTIEGNTLKNKSNGIIEGGTISNTTISGANITTGTISSDIMKTIKVEASNITGGTLNADVIYGGTIEANKITTNYSKIKSAQIDSIKADQIDVREGKISAGQIEAISVSADDITTGTIKAKIEIQSPLITYGSSSYKIWLDDNGRISMETGISAIAVSSLNAYIYGSSLVNLQTSPGGQITLNAMGQGTTTSVLIQGDLEVTGTIKGTMA